MSTGKLESTGGRWQLRFTRELAHPQEKVWRAAPRPPLLALQPRSQSDHCGTRATRLPPVLRTGLA